MSSIKRKAGFQTSLHGWKEITPEKTLFRGSLVTFLTNELGTQCPCLVLTGKTWGRGSVKRYRVWWGGSHTQYSSVGKPPGISFTCAWWEICSQWRVHSTTTTQGQGLWVSGEFSQLPIGQQWPGENWETANNSCIHHRRLPKIFKRIWLVYFLSARSSFKYYCSSSEKS